MNVDNWYAQVPLHYNLQMQHPRVSLYFSEPYGEITRFLAIFYPMLTYQSRSFG